MSALASRTRLLAGGVAAAVLLASYAGAQGPRPPDFMTSAAWLLTSGDFKAIPGSTPSPVRQDTRYRYVPNNTSEQPTYRIGDVSNPNLKPWVAAAMNVNPRR